MRTELVSRRLVAAAVVAGLFVVPRMAQAQDVPGEGTFASSGTSATICTTTTVLVGLGIVAGAVYGSYTTTTKKEPKEEEVKKAERDELGRAVKAYLASNQLQMRQDLAVGAGPFVRDLAAAARIREVQLSRFGEVLRANRTELLDLGTTDGLTSERALQFLARIGDLTKADAELSASYRAWAEQQGLGG